MSELPPLSVVALIEELPERDLLCGQLGTVIEELAPGVYEVEFSDDQGQTYASVALPGDRLLRLHHEPRQHAAWAVTAWRTWLHYRRGLPRTNWLGHIPLGELTDDIEIVGPNAGPFVIRGSRVRKWWTAIPIRDCANGTHALESLR